MICYVFEFIDWNHFFSLLNKHTALFSSNHKNKQNAFVIFELEQKSVSFRQTVVMILRIPVCPRSFDS